jgi:antitoxin (DNA-binding transcriptional repressor) of toxin-antitoxin stability system
MAIFLAMSSYSVAEARNALSELIERALAGAEVVITRHGTPVVALRALAPPPPPMTPEDMDRLAARRVTPLNRGLESGRLLNAMRGEDDARLFRR